MMKVKIGTTEWQQLLGRIKANDATLTSLDLSFNQIGDAGAQALAVVLKDNRTLTRLGLEGNQIGDAGVQALAVALKDNRTLTLRGLKKFKGARRALKNTRPVAPVTPRHARFAHFFGSETDYHAQLQPTIPVLPIRIPEPRLEPVAYLGPPASNQNAYTPRTIPRSTTSLTIDPTTDAFKARIKELEDLVKLQQVRLDKFKYNLEEKEDEIEALTMESDELRDQSDDLKLELADQQEYYEKELKSARMALKQELEEKEDEIEALTMESGELRDQSDELRLELADQQQYYEKELKSARMALQQEQDQRQTLWQQQQLLVKNFAQDQQRREQLWQQQQKTLQTVEDTLQKERQNLQKRQDKIKQDKQRLATDKQRLQQEKLDCETQRKALEAHSTQQPAPDVQKQLDALKIKERELEDKAKAFEQREQSLQQLQQSNAQLEQRLEARAQELEQKDQGFADLKTAYAVLKQKLAVAETDRQKAAGIEDKLTQQEQELASLRTQLTQRQLSAPGVNTQDLATKIAEQEKTVHALQQQLAEAKQQAEQARNEALALKAQLDKQSAQVAQAAKSINPHFGAKASQWPLDYQRQHELFKATLEKIQAQYGQAQKLSCFVSYAWGEPTQETEVKRLVDYLKLAGFTIPFDRDNLPGQEPTHKFIQNINDVDFVVICGSKKMMEKYRWKPKTREDRQPVVKTELDLIESLITKNEYEQRRMRPVVFEGSVDESLPPLLRTYVYYHFQFVDYFDILFGLIQSLYGIRNDDAIFQGLKNEFQKQAEAIAKEPEVQSNNNSVHALVSPVDASQLQQLTEENQTLKQIIEKLESRIKALEAALFEKTQLKEEAAVTMQKVFRGFMQRKKQPLKSLQENRRQEVDGKLDEWFRAKKYRELAELGNLAESGQWHAAMQMIRGKPLQAKEAEIEIPAKTKDSVGHGKAWTIKFRY